MRRFNEEEEIKLFIKEKIIKFSEIFYDNFKIRYKHNLLSGINPLLTDLQYLVCMAKFSI